MRAAIWLLTLYPGAIEAFDRAIAADPGFALAHAGKAQVLMREGNVVAARAALDGGQGAWPPVCRRGRPATSRSSICCSRAGPNAAIAALHAHLASWPRDALVLATAANPNGLIGASGRIGQKHQIAVLMDSLAPHYGDDFWFLAHHAMALSEDGQLAAARPKIERSVALEPEQRAWRARVRACVLREGEPDAARAFLSSWLATYPRDGFFHGHLSWHLALCELEAGNRGRGVPAVSRRHRARPAQRRAATENVGCDGVPVAVRTRRPSARRRRLARDA